MLNISPNSIQTKVKLDDFMCSTKVNLTSSHSMFIRYLLLSFFVIIVIFFLPWTQNINAKGKVTTLKPGQRPQTIHSTIAGRIEHWYVQEGQFVKKGDTIAFLSEIKAEYFDPTLVDRTKKQVDAKAGSISSYQSKAKAMEEQITAYEREVKLKVNQIANKIKQTQNKITSDSITWERSKIDYQIAQNQLKREDEMFKKGLTSLLDLEQKKLKVQETKAKMVGAENKLIISRNELLNVRLSKDAIQYEYTQKIAKASSDRFSALSDQFTSEADLNKLKILATNYEKRSEFYVITAPQDAYVIQALKPGIGETIKEGDALVSIMPAEYDLAVEMYVKPMDLPLLELGQEVRFIFDGWPAFIFSGWPDFSFGTFSGEIVAIDRIISTNNKFRVLVSPSNTEKEWPPVLRPGSGANGIALLNDVPVWYEIWRRLNGFPPDLYDEKEELIPKLKAPIKSIPK